MNTKTEAQFIAELFELESDQESLYRRAAIASTEPNVTA